MENERYMNNLSKLSFQPSSSITISRTNSINQSSFSKLIQNKIERRSIVKKSPSQILSQEDKIKLIKLKFPDKKPSVDPITSIIDLKEIESLSYNTNNAKKAFLIGEQKKKIYLENDVNLTITESDYNEYYNLIFRDFKIEYEEEYEDSVEIIKDRFPRKISGLKLLGYSMKKMLSDCFNEAFYENEEKKVNYLKDIYQGPIIKNRLSSNHLKTSSLRVRNPHLSQFEVLCESTIGPNYYDNKLNLHINNLKRKYQNTKDREIYMNKGSKAQSELKFNCTYDHLQNEVVEKFRNVGNFIDMYGYFMEKYKKYESKIKLLNKEKRKKVAL
jgi:hypothetical protein